MSTFRAAASATLDANGYGEVTLAPPGVGWLIELTSVTVSSRVAEPEFSLYHLAVSDANFLEGTFSGSRDSSDTSHRVQPGEAVIGVWTGGDPGATATLRISGTVA